MTIFIDLLTSALFSTAFRVVLTYLGNYIVQPHYIVVANV